MGSWRSTNVQQSAHASRSRVRRTRADPPVPACTGVQLVY